MKRKIKFRAFNQKWRSMHDNIAVINDNIIIWTFDDDNYGELQWDYIDDNIHVMQFTGLYDKNGKEVFEGDVIKWGVNTNLDKDEFQRFSSYEVWAIVQLNPDIQFEVLFHINLCTNEKYKPFYDIDKIIKYGRFDFRDDSFEIIGNIFEHGHLLEQNND